MSDEFSCRDEGQAARRAGKKPYEKNEYKPYDVNASSPEELSVSDAALEAKYNVLEKMWEKLGRPCDDFKDIQKALILVGNRGEIFVWDEISEKYEYWYNKDDMWAALRDFCPTIHAGSRWPTKNSVYVMRNYAIRLKKIDYHMKGYWNEIDLIGREAKISVLHKSRFKPKYHEDVNRWLMAFGGKQATNFLDWLASFTMLNDSTCMLYICGAKGIGKNLLAESLAQIYGGFSDWEDRASDYQSDMGRNPFIWANEDMEKPRRTTIMAAIRRLIAGGSQRINEKQRPAYGMECYYRLLVTANNPKLLKSWANLSSDDVEAVRERVGYFYASAAAKYELEALAKEKGIAVRELTASFAAGKVAEHVLWLGQNRKIAGAENRRLLVEGWENEVTDMLEFETGESFLFANAFNKARTSAVCNWLKQEGDQYFVNFNFMVDSWDEFGIKDTDRIRWKEMRDFIKTIGDGEKKRIRPYGTKSNPVYYWRLDSEKLRKMLINYGFDEEDVDDIVKVDSPVKPLEIEMTIHNQNIISIIDSIDLTETKEDGIALVNELILNETIEKIDSILLDKKTIKNFAAELRRAIRHRNWEMFNELIEEAKYEQVEWSGKERVSTKSSVESGGDDWSDFDLDNG